MMKIHIYSIGACLLFLSGCNNEVVNPDNERVPISFSAEIPSLLVEEVQTRATDFPNSGSIAVVAANSASATPITSTDWSSGNVYLNHLAATVGDKNGTIYPVTFGSTQYWPFDPDKYLSFLSYSPATHSSLSHSLTDLTVNITGKSYSFPDLLYTAPVGPFNKENSYNSERGRAYLGEFKHAMAKLVVKVIAVDQNGTSITSSTTHPLNNVQITSLAIKTKATSGTFNLVNSEWTLSDPTSSTLQTVYTLVSSSTPAAVPYTNETFSVCYLLPATSDVNTVNFGSVEFYLKDISQNTTLGGDFPLSGFKQADGTTTVTLESGKITILTIKLQFTAIPPISPTVQLQGQLVDWNDKGSSVVTIE